MYLQGALSFMLLPQQCLSPKPVNVPSIILQHIPVLLMLKLPQYHCQLCFGQDHRRQIWMCPDCFDFLNEHLEFLKVLRTKMPPVLKVDDSI